MSQSQHVTKNLYSVEHTQKNFDLTAKILRCRFVHGKQLSERSNNIVPTFLKHYNKWLKKYLKYLINQLYRKIGIRS
jgi:hypothetical protein